MTFGMRVIACKVSANLNRDDVQCVPALLASKFRRKECDAKSLPACSHVLQPCAATIVLSLLAIV